MKTQLLRIFGFLLLSSLLAVHACGQDIPREGSLTSVLELWKPRDYGQNLRIIEALNTWTKPLGNDEVTALRKYAEEKEGKLWKLHFSAMQLLRKNGLLKQPTGNTRMAEELLARADTYRDNPELVDQLAAFGPEIIPLLRDVFTCDGQSEHIVAIRALRKIGGKPAVETLTYALKRENAGSVAGEFVPALLALGNDDAAVDSIAKLITSKQGFAQSHAVRAMQEAGVPNQAKMQFYSHFSEFGSDGKDAVIRALSSLGTREAFAQLSAILLNRTGNTQLATLQLAEMDAFDPGGVFEDIFKAGDITEQLMMCSAIRGCTVVIPYLQKVRSTQCQGMQADYSTLAAAALARLGNDVEQNTEVLKAAIKQEKPNYYVLEAAGILRDDATLQILLGRMETDGWDRSESVIRSLGHTRNPAAAKALLDGLETFPLRVWYAIGPAVEELGTDLKDEGIKSDGAGLNATITYIRFAYGAMSPRPDSPSVIRAEHDAAAFMKKHPRLFKKIFSEHPVDNFPKWYNPYAVKLAGLAWTPEATHVLEAIITTDQNKVNDRYRVRRELARLLQEKTGRPYTYVDADGKIKNSEDE